MSKTIQPTFISTVSNEAVGIDFHSQNVGAFSPSQTYPSASRVLAYPFQLGDAFLVKKVWWANGGTATTDSCDVGVYSEDGATLHVSGGSTGISGANVLQEKDCTDTLLVPGRYWCAYVQSGVTATPLMTPAGATAIILQTSGCAQMAGSGSTLGSTFTAASISGLGFPLFGIAATTAVA
jgi:hypothetical protein